MHADPVASVVIRLAVILAAAKLGGHVAVRAKQPAVLGELLAGVLLGMLPLPFLGSIREDVHVDMLARLGVLVLLFEVGLESTVAQMLKVGRSSLQVACVGVAVPFLLGLGAGWLLLPDAPHTVHLFLGATLTATSVGITARVLKDLDVQNSGEAHIILGAAVIDDVLGLVMLAVVGGIVQDGGVDAGGVALIVVKAGAFLAGSLVLGMWLSPRLFRLASHLQSTGVLLATGLAVCFLFAWIADAIGLAAIVGAFAAGLVLEAVHFRDFTSRGEHGLEDLMKPISGFLVPVFFVLMGMRTDVTALLKPGVLAVGIALIVVAIAGKLVCGYAAIGKDLDKRAIGIGMVPRGEVGLIFANVGLGLKVMDAPLFSAVVMMVIVTTLMTPPALSWRFRNRRA